jgi:hypothetical protein
MHGLMEPTVEKGSIMNKVAALACVATLAASSAAFAEDAVKSTENADPFTRTEIISSQGRFGGNGAIAVVGGVFIAAATAVAIVSSSGTD